MAPKRITRRTPKRKRRAAQRRRECPRTPLQKGEAEFLAKLTSAIKLVGVDHPFVRDAIDVHHKIMQAEPGYRGRYVQTRLGAARGLLETLIGKPGRQVDDPDAMQSYEDFLASRGTPEVQTPTHPAVEAEHQDPEPQDPEPQE